MLKRRLLFVLLAAAGCSPAWPIRPAVAGDDHVDAARLRAAGQILPLEQILQRARAERPGKILDTELEREHGRYIYELEILDEQGVVWKMEFDAKTGALLKSKRDD